MLKLSLIKINAIRWLGAAIIYYASLYKVVPMATSKLRTYFTPVRDFECFVKIKTEKIKPCSLYPGVPVIQIPATFFRKWAVWQNEKDSVPAKSRTSPQGAILKSFSNNINADKRPPFEVKTPRIEHNNKSKLQGKIYTVRNPKEPTENQRDPKKPKKPKIRPEDM